MKLCVRGRCRACPMNRTHSRKSLSLFLLLLLWYNETDRPLAKPSSPEYASGILPPAQLVPSSSGGDPACTVPLTPNHDSSSSWRAEGCSTWLLKSHISPVRSLDSNLTSTLPLPSCVTLGRYLTSPSPSCYIHNMGSVNYLAGLLWELSRIIQKNGSVDYQAYNTSSKSISPYQTEKTWGPSRTRFSRWVDTQWVFYELCPAPNLLLSTSLHL